MSSAANQTFEQCDRGEIVIYIPTICLIEIIYLQEKGCISPELKSQLDTELLAGNNGFILADLTAEVVNVLATVPRTAVPDLPDRIIAATAFHLGLPLISCDRRMPLTGISLIW